MQWTKHASWSESQAQQHDLTNRGSVLEKRVYERRPHHMSTTTTSTTTAGWRSAPDAILPGHRRAPQWVPARTPTVHLGPDNGEAVGGPPQRHNFRSHDAMTHHPDSPTHKSSDKQISYFCFSRLCLRVLSCSMFSNV